MIHPGQNLLIRPVASAKLATPNQSVSKTSSAKIYTVKAGASVWRIASIHGISMEELIALNDIKNYTIHPNQTLIVGSMINREAEKLAKELGYEKTNERSDGRPIFKNKKKNPKFITPDNTKHIGKCMRRCG